MRKSIFAVLGLLVGIALILSCAPAKPTQPTPTAEPIIVGIPTSLYTPTAQGCIDYTKIALEEINAKGGVNIGGVMHPMEIVIADTRGGEPGTPVHEALMAYEKLITEQKPHVINVGAFRSEVLMAAMDLIAKYKIPHMGTIAQTPKFIERFREDPAKYKYLFRCTTNSYILVDLYLKQAHDFLREEVGLTKAIFMAQDSLWNRALVESLRDHMIKTGWTDLGYEKYAGDATDFSPFLTKAKETGAEVIVQSWDVPLGAGIFIKQYAAMGVPALLTGFSMPLCSPKAWETMGPGIEYAIQIDFPAGSSLACKKLPGSVEIMQKYEQKFNRLPASASTISAYVGLYLLKDAIERAGSLDADAIVDALEKTDIPWGYPGAGIIGRCRFDEDHQLIYGLDPNEAGVCAIVQWVKPGVRVPVFPPAIAEAEIQRPAK